MEPPCCVWYLHRAPPTLDGTSSQAHQLAMSLKRDKTCNTYWFVRIKRGTQYKRTLSPAWWLANSLFTLYINILLPHFMFSNLHILLMVEGRGEVEIPA